MSGLYSTPSALAPRLAAPMTLRPSPDPRSMTKSCGVTFARSSMRSTVTSGVGTHTTSLPACPTSGLNVLSCAEAGTAAARSRSMTHGAFERWRCLRCAATRCQDCIRESQVPTVWYATAMTPSDDPEIYVRQLRDRHRRRARPSRHRCPPRARAPATSDARTAAPASVEAGPGTSTSDVASSRSSGNRRTEFADGRIARQADERRVLAEKRASINPRWPAREVASLEVGEETLADLRRLRNRLQADASPLARRP